MRRTSLLLRAFLPVVLTLTANGQIFNRNLVVNGDAESGAAATGEDQPPVQAIPGWTIGGSFTTGRYGGLNLLGPASYGPVEHGDNYFLGALGSTRSNTPSTATQTIDLSPAAAEIDAGRVRFYLSGYLGCSCGGAGNSSLKATFLDPDGKTLLEATLRGPSADEIQYMVGILQRATSGYLLPNTRKVKITLDLGKSDLEPQFLSADNIALSLATESVTGQNLIVNPGFEDAPDHGSLSYSPVPGWNTHIYAEAAPYNDSTVGTEDPGPKNRGQYLLSFWGPETPVRAWQAVDLTLARELIDSGAVSYNLSGWLGGARDLPDTAEMALEFYDASGQLLATAETGTVGAADRAGAAALLSRSLTGTVPASTRQAKVILTFRQQEDTDYLLAYADNISLVLSAGPASIDLNGITNGASGANGAVAPGEIVTIAIAGVNLDGTTRTQFNTEGRVATDLAGVKVYFDGTQAPMLYVNSSQIGAIVPFDVDGKKETILRVEYKGVKSNNLTAAVAAAAPGIYTQEAPGAANNLGEIFNDGWLLNSSANRAAKGSVVTILWTGGGQTLPAGLDGRIETGTLPRPKLPVTVKIDGQTAELLFAGAVPFSWDGLLMAQVKVPAAASTAAPVPVVIAVDGIASPANGATMWVQ